MRQLAADSKGAKEVQKRRKKLPYGKGEPGLPAYLPSCKWLAPGSGDCRRPEAEPSATQNPMGKGSLGTYRFVRACTRCSLCPLKGIRTWEGTWQLPAQQRLLPALPPR